MIALCGKLHGVVLKSILAQVADLLGSTTADKLDVPFEIDFELL